MESFHSAVKANQIPALLVEHSLTTRVVPNGIKAACLDQWVSILLTPEVSVDLMLVAGGEPVS